MVSEMFYFEKIELLWVFPLLALILVLLHIKGYEIFLEYSRFYHPLARFLKKKGKRDRRYSTLILKILLALIISMAMANPYVLEEKRIEAEGSEGELKLEARPAVVLVLDSSGSMGEFIDGVVKMEAAKKAVERLLEVAPEEIDFGLVVFESRIKLAVPITGNRSRILGEMGKIEAGGGTGYGPALSTALVWLKPYRVFNVSCAAVLVSDGMPGDKPGYERVLEEYVKYGIPIHTIYIGREGEAGEREAAMIAEKTGGGHYTATSVDGLVKAFENIGERVSELKVETKVYTKVKIKKSLSNFLVFIALILLFSLWLARFYHARISF